MARAALSTRGEIQDYADRPVSFRGRHATGWAAAFERPWRACGSCGYAGRPSISVSGRNLSSARLAGLLASGNHGLASGVHSCFDAREASVDRGTAGHGDVAGSASGSQKLRLRACRRPGLAALSSVKNHIALHVHLQRRHRAADSMRRCVNGREHGYAHVFDQLAQDW